MSNHLIATKCFLVLLLTNVNSLQNCSNLFIRDMSDCNCDMSETSLVQYHNTEWYYSDLSVQRISFYKKTQQNLTQTLFENEESKKPFKHLNLFVIPIRVSNDGLIVYKARFCINLSPEDVTVTDWINLEFISKDYMDVLNITNSRTCRKSSEPFLTFCYWSTILIADHELTVQLKIESEESYEEFRFRLPDWEGEHNAPLEREKRKKPCDFQPFTYSTREKIFVKLENCTKLLNVTIFVHENNNTTKIREYQNVTLNEALVMDRPSDSNLSHYYSGKVTFLIDDSMTTSDGMENQTTNSPIEDFSPTEKTQSYILVYLIPLILCIVMGIAFLILRPEIRNIWKKVTRQTVNPKPTVRFLYCKCNAHSVHGKQLETLLKFIEKYCNIILEDQTERQYEDNEALLRKRYHDVDYIILVPMPEVTPSCSENESNVQNIEEFKNTKEKKRIILQIPFDGDFIAETHAFVAANFKLMDDFIPFIQHVHQKYSTEQRDFLSVAKIIEITQKLEDHHLTDGGFEFLGNQFAVQTNAGNGRVSYNFPDLNDLSL